MLSQSEKLSKLEEKKRILSLPELERPRTVRLKFRKVGSLQYISHLDLLRTMQTALRRAKVMMIYSEGFNPHMKITFALPLSIGTESVCEYMDIRTQPDVDPLYVKEILHKYFA